VEQELRNNITTDAMAAKNKTLFILVLKVRYSRIHGVLVKKNSYRNFRGKWWVEFYIIVVWELK
jgi:hypothetical protein